MHGKEIKIYPFRLSDKMKDDWPWNETTWWRVVFYEDVEDMRKDTDGKTCNDCGDDFGSEDGTMGLCHMHGFATETGIFGDVVQKDIEGEIGVIYLCGDSNGVGTVSHEIMHAVIRTAMHLTGNINLHHPQFEEFDEWLAQIMGNLMNSFYTQVEA